jgi:outer membrane protein insertion porin family
MHPFLECISLTHILARSFPDALRRVTANPSVSVGIGLVYRFDPVRLEVNFGMPLVAHKTDGYQRGFQIGFGLECL